jgi:hypothetical protein
MSPYSCLHTMPPCLFLHVHISPYPCLNFHVSMCLCLHVSMSLSLHVFMSPLLHSPCFHVFLYISMSPSPCLYVSMSMFSEFHKQKLKLTEKWQLPFTWFKWKIETANFLLFAANGNKKWKFVFLGWKRITGNRLLQFQQSCPSMGMFETKDRFRCQRMLPKEPFSRIICPQLCIK